MATTTTSAKGNQVTESAKTVGTIVNVVLILAGAVYCVYGIYIQVINNF